MKEILELHGAGESIRSIARKLQLSRNSVRKYLRSPGIPTEKPREARPSKLDPHKEFVRARLSEGVENCVVLMRDLRARGYGGSYSILKEYVHPFRRPRQPAATMRFETTPGEQAQVDWGLLPYIDAEGRRRSVWAFVMVLSWSRAIYVELVQRADVGTFIRCHVNAFQALGGVPKKCLYDNAKVVTLGRNGDGTVQWNSRFLDLSLRLGFEIRLCRPYRAQTKGRVESGVKYVRHNFWPAVKFTTLDDLNQQARAWIATVANDRIHGTTKERPSERLERERLHLAPTPEAQRLTPFLRDDRKVGRDGFVSWEGAWYGVNWRLVGKVVQVQTRDDRIELWDGDDLLAVHPHATRRGERFTTPGQWAGLELGETRPPKEPTGFQVIDIEVERRSLAQYEALVEAGVAS